MKFKYRLCPSDYDATATGLDGMLNLKVQTFDEFLQQSQHELTHCEQNGFQCCTSLQEHQELKQKPFHGIFCI